MLNLLFLSTALATPGTINKIENDVVHIVFEGENSVSYNIVMPSILVPCEASVGDNIYVRKTEDMTIVRCTAFPVIPPTSPTIEVRIDPSTGEMEYIIQNIPLE